MRGKKIMENNSKVILNALKNMDAETYSRQQEESYNRLCNEIQQTYERIRGLQYFISTNVLYCVMSFEEKELLDKQLKTMVSYYNILCERKEKFKVYTLDEVIKYLKLGD